MSITNVRKYKKERKGKNISPGRRKQGKWNHMTWKNEHGGRGPSGGQGGIVDSGVQMRSVVAAS
jgi:hypothetical protein